jgi:uncharacterized protein YprB with RNaseH-like and TPR domain
LSTLADRIRAIVRTPGAPGVSPAAPPDPTNLPDLRDPRDLLDPPDPRDLSDPLVPNPTNPPDPRALPVLERALGGEWRAGCFVVDRRLEPSARHGREAIGHAAERLEQASDNAALFTSGAPARPPFIFFDLETTGLSGGAGTLAFLIGCGWFEPDGAFVTRQFLLTRFVDERPLLEAVAAELGRAGALVSFNGKSFDAPLLETRFLFHRLEWLGGRLPHVDVLHPARRFWQPRDGHPKGLRYVGGEGLVAQRFRAARPDASSCSLQTLEREIVGARRAGDVPGFEIPGRYFQFVRSADAGPLRAVLEHNRLDLLTLASLTARLLHLTRTGPAGARDAREALALGHVYTRAGFEERARAAYRHAIDRCRSPRGAYDPIRIHALRMLALAWRRARRYEDAASCWCDLLAIRGCPPPLEREATAALAVHHEHRRRDLSSAKAFALRSLESGALPAWRNAVHHRLARLDRKMAVQNLKLFST